MARKDFYYKNDAPSPNSIVAAASAIVVNEYGEILMHRRKDNDLWSLLGGAMEYGEYISDTIIREVKEESGLNVDIVKLIGIYSNPNHIIAYSDGEVRQQFSICFHCKIDSGNLVISDESKDLKFFTVDELDDVNMHPAQRVRIKDYLLKKEKAFVR